MILLQSFILKNAVVRSKGSS